MIGLYVNTKKSGAEELGALLLDRLNKNNVPCRKIDGCIDCNLDLIVSVGGDGTVLGVAESAAKQSKRTIIPEVHDAITINQLKNRYSDFDILLVPYESKNGMQDTKTALEKIKGGMTVGILIGPEGGFDESEIRSVTDMGAHVISLGKRILRTETAAITALSMCMLYAEMNLGE